MDPAIERLAGEKIGGAQGLDRRGIGHEREARHQQETDGLRRVVAHVSNLTDFVFQRQEGTRTRCHTRPASQQGIPGSVRYSVFSLLKNSFSGHKNWAPAWREP